MKFMDILPFLARRLALHSSAKKLLEWQFHAIEPFERTAAFHRLAESAQDQFPSH
jgi:hypothetical protein